MLQRSRVREELLPPDDTPLKRARQHDVTIVGNAPGKLSQKPAVILSTVDTEALEPSPGLSEARLKQKAAVVAMRFQRAIRRHDATTMKICLESGYVPTVGEWLNIIGKMHVVTALACVTLCRSLQTPCITAAMRRQHRALFDEVITRVDTVPVSHMETLMTVPAYYLDRCLRKGLDPNTPLKNKRLPLEHACAHSRIAHIETLLKDPRTKVSQTVCRFMIRRGTQQKFAERAIELCDDIVPSIMMEAVVANVSAALCSIMAKLEPRYSGPVWDSITHMLRCPISQDYSTDLVRTPLNEHYYDRTQLLTWVKAKGTDPQTREPLTEGDLLLRSEFLKEFALALQSKLEELDK